MTAGYFQGSSPEVQKPVDEHSFEQLAAWVRGLGALRILVFSTVGRGYVAYRGEPSECCGQSLRPEHEDSRLDRSCGICSNTARRIWKRRREFSFRAGLLWHGHESDPDLQDS